MCLPAQYPDCRETSAPPFDGCASMKLMKARALAVGRRPVGNAAHKSIGGSVQSCSTGLTIPVLYGFSRSPPAQATRAARPRSSQGLMWPPIDVFCCLRGLAYTSLTRSLRRARQHESLERRLHDLLRPTVSSAARQAGDSPTRMRSINHSVADLNAVIAAGSASAEIGNRDDRRCSWSRA
jgi:hypothetical protein